MSRGTYYSVHKSSESINCQQYHDYIYMTFADRLLLHCVLTLLRDACTCCIKKLALTACMYNCFIVNM